MYTYIDQAASLSHVVSKVACFGFFYLFLESQVASFGLVSFARSGNTGWSKNCSTKATEQS